MKSNYRKTTKNGQVSTEFLIIIAAILVLFIPLLVFTYFKASEANEQVMEVQAQVIAIRLSELSNSVGSAGVNSSIIAEIFVPSSVKNISIISAGSGGEVVVRSITQTGSNDITGLVKFKITPKLFVFSNAGVVRFEISGGSNAVEIQRVN